MIVNDDKTLYKLISYLGQKWWLLTKVIKFGWQYYALSSPCLLWMSATRTRSVYIISLIFLLTPVTQTSPRITVIQSSAINNTILNRMKWLATATGELIDWVRPDERDKRVNDGPWMTSTCSLTFQRLPPVIAYLIWVVHRTIYYCLLHSLGK